VKTTSIKKIDFQEYEFDESQQKNLIEDLSNDMSFVGVFLIILGFLVVLGGFLRWRLDEEWIQGLTYILTGLFTVSIAFWTIKAANSFKLIVNHQGNDIKNLMSALGKVKTIYSLQFWFLWLAPIYIVVLGIMSV
jgi:hypothetical protein